jgi:hypothetical protein
MLDFHHGSLEPAHDDAIVDQDLAFGAPDPDEEDPYVEYDTADLRLTPPMVLYKMITAKKSWDHSPNSPLWVLDRYTARLERARAAALRMLLTLQKRKRPDDDDEGDDVADADAPLRNEPTEPPPPPEAQETVSDTDTTDKGHSAADAGGESEPTGDSPEAAEATESRPGEAGEECLRESRQPGSATRVAACRATPRRSAAEPPDQPVNSVAEDIPASSRPAPVAAPVGIGEAPSPPT